MQHRISHQRLALWAVLAAAVLLLTAPAASAQTQAAEAAVAAVESTAPVETASVEAEPATAEPTPAPDPAPQTSETAPAQGPAPQAVDTATEAGADAGETVGATTQATQPTDPTTAPVLRGSDPQAPADGSSATVSEVDRTIARVSEVDQTIAPATQAGQTTTEAAVDGVASAGDLPQPGQALPELSRKIQRDAAGTFGHTENVLGEAVDRIDLGRIEDLGMAAATPLEGPRGALPLAAAPQRPGVSTVLPPPSPAGPTDERAIPLDGLPGPHISARGGIQTLPLGGPRTPESYGMGAASPGGDRRFSSTTKDPRFSSSTMDPDVGDTERGSREPAPLDNPAPDDLPQVGVSPSGATSFLPIAALLALLALVAPAIDRRRRMTVACSPPIPFVCALERPG